MWFCKYVWGACLCVYVWGGYGVHGVCMDEMYSVCTWGHVQILVPYSIEQAGAELSVWTGNIH